MFNKIKIKEEFNRYPIINQIRTNLLLYVSYDINIHIKQTQTKINYKQNKLQIN